jgi:ParB family chromosome partitioning protein
MPSGDFTTVPIDSITINREARQRRDLEPKPLAELADSIARLGLIHPPVITRDGELVAGERRLEAVRSLGWDRVAVQYTDELDPSALRAIELEENIKRLDLTWQDRCRGIAEYHELRKAEEPAWTMAQTGEALGMVGKNVSNYLRVFKELDSPKIVTAPKFSTALNVVERRDSRRADAAIERFQTIEASDDFQILTADFLQWASTYEGPKFNLIHCDFPYGIDYEGFKIHGAQHDTYGDSADTYRTLIRALLVEHLDRLVDASAHLIFWFSMKHYQETLDAIRSAGFTCDGFPLIWHKSDNAGTLPDPQRGPRRVYESAFFATRGDRRVVSAVSNSIALPSDRATRDHLSHKPLPVLQHFFRMLVDDSTTLLDPTCGSGTAIRAAKGLHGRRAIGLEIDPAAAEIRAAARTLA